MTCLHLESYSNNYDEYRYQEMKVYYTFRVDTIRFRVDLRDYTYKAANKKWFF